MSKKSDDSIERIFRQALTQYDTKFHEGDWLKMEILLNEEAERKAAARSRRIKGTAYTLTGLTGLIIAVYFLAIKNPSGSIADSRDSVTEMQASEALTENGNVKHENPSEGLLSPSSTSESSKGELDGSVSSTDDSDAENTSSLTETTQIRKSLDDGDKARGVQGSPNDPLQNTQDKSSALPNKSTALLNPATPLNERQRNERIPLSQSAPHTVSTSEQADSNLTNNLSNKSIPSLTSPVVPENVEAVDDKFQKGNEKKESTSQSVTSGESGKDTLQSVGHTIDRGADHSATPSQVESQNETPGADSTLVDEEILNTSPADSSTLARAGKADLPDVIPPSRWSVAFVIAPEFSTTSLSSYSSPGESFGLRIGYQLSNKFSLNTGLIRSTKKYEGSGDGYKPRNPAYWQNRTNGVVPEEIYSKCLVYELPLGLQFDAIQTSKSRVFVSTAISSYLMISQAYDYTFATPNPGADTGWRSPGSESYWFSVGMLSAGYERYINRSFAIGIEPYLKVSLSEIGWPNIKLFSTGAYVTLRYKFMSRRNF